MCFSLTITASCPMNLQYFPMDRQLCHIEIESCKYATHARVHIYISIHIFTHIYKCIQTKYDFAEFNILAYVTSLLDILTHTLFAHTVMEVKETFPCTSMILLLNDNRLAVSFWRQSSTVCTCSK